MRHVAHIAIALCAFCARGAPHGPITVVLQFSEPPSASSLVEMKKEVASLFEGTPLRFEFESKDGSDMRRSYSDLVVVTLNGRCAMDAGPVFYDERGPLAFTHSSDGRVLPFSEVECDHVRASVEKALVPGTRDRDRLLGRAMGRVVAHELYHMFANTPLHGNRGVGKAALTPAQLVSGELPFAESELRALRDP